ncbi:hypothetical protein [Sorangium sp. So ce861]|uniref:hypothetical protein n=1 Tax=Sorangium sp. So ce861 TaxID=3133323 RepID=UPI003F6386E7
MPGDKLFSGGWWLRLFFRLAVAGLLVALASWLLRVRIMLLVGIALCVPFPLVLGVVIVVRGTVLVLEKLREGTTGRE